MGVPIKEGIMFTKNCILHEVNNYIFQIEQGNNLKPEYTAGFYFKYLLQLKKFEKIIENMDFPDLFESDHYYKCLFYDTKFVVQIRSFENNDEKKGRHLEIVILETPLMSVNDYARLYGVKEGAVRQWIRRGMITNAIKYGNEWRIPEFCDAKAPKQEKHEYYWDSNLTDLPEGFDCFEEYDTLTITKDKENDGFILFFSARFKKVHDNLKRNVDDKTKEKIELWLIANPLVMSPGALIDVLG